MNRAPIGPRPDPPLSTDETDRRDLAPNGLASNRQRPRGFRDRRRRVRRMPKADRRYPAEPPALAR